MYQINDGFRIGSMAEEEEGGELSAEQTIAMRFASTRPVDISPLEFGKSTRYLINLMKFVQCNNFSPLILGEQMIFFPLHFCRKGSGNNDSRLRKNSDKQDSNNSTNGKNGDINIESGNEDKIDANKDTSNGKHQEDSLASGQEEILKKSDENDDEGIKYSDNEATNTKLKKPPPNKVSYLITLNNLQIQNKNTRHNWIFTKFFIMILEKDGKNGNFQWRITRLSYW